MGRGMRVEGSMNYVLDVSAAEGEFGAENWIDYVLEKLREIGRAMSPEEWINFVREKLKEFLAVLEHWARVAAPYIIAIVAAVAFLILLRYFIGCCCSVVRGGVLVVKTMIRCVVGGGVSVVKTMIRCVGGGGGSAVKTMIAPGTAGAVRIPRAPFEANPALYFRSLRGR